jgi:hypothetical protein
MSFFKDRLLTTVGPRLKASGYEYDDALRDRDLIYGFRKHLGGEIYAIILFQRQQHREHPVDYGFTVNLIRCKTSEPSRWYLGGYEGSLDVRLGAVICYVYYGWRHCPYNAQWWIPANKKEIEPKFVDALEKLETYGIPFLEDPDSKRPGILSNAEATQFHKLVVKIVSPELQKLGFEIVEWAGDMSVCFRRGVFGSLNAFIIFVQSLGESQEQLGIQVRLFRNRGDVPSGPWPQYEGYLEKPLDFLLRHNYDFQNDVPTVWSYSNEEELEKQLQDLVEKIERYAVPWLEDPLSANQLQAPPADNHIQL